MSEKVHASFGKPREVGVDLAGESFSCTPGYPLEALITQTESFAAAMEAPGAEFIRWARDFISSALVDGDRERFAKLLDSPHASVEANDVGQAAVWLMGVYTGNRPTAGSSGSSDGPSNTGTESKAGSSSPGSDPQT